MSTTDTTDTTTEDLDRLEAATAPQDVEMLAIIESARGGDAEALRECASVLASMDIETEASLA